MKENGSYTELNGPRQLPVNGAVTQVKISKDNTIGERVLSQELREVLEDDKPTKIKKDTSYLSVFELWGKYPLNWKANRTEIDAAKNILAEHGLEKAAAALRYSRGAQEEIHCPQILKPSDLDRKWVNLIAFRDKR